MIAVIQRVKEASVVVNQKTIGQIGPGLLTFFGVEKGDPESDIERMIRKICELRIFEDEQGKMNKSLIDTGGAHLIVSQFTLAGDCRKGKRPSFIGAEAPERAKAMYKEAIIMSRSMGVQTESGQFQADMKVSSINDGPVTIILKLKDGQFQ